MPAIVKELTEDEKIIEMEIINSFSVEKIRAFILSKNLISIYQFNDAFINDWYLQIFGLKSSKNVSKRTELVLEYANMLCL